VTIYPACSRRFQHSAICRSFGDARSGRLRNEEASEVDMGMIPNFGVCPEYGLALADDEGNMGGTGRSRAR
jgi:hypothetical protein